MAVTPFKTFSAGEVLTASDLNSSFSQVFDNGEDLGWPATKTKDLNGQEFILDADGDTSLTADTDDQIDIKIAGTDYITLSQGATANITDANGSITTTGNVINCSNADALTTGRILNLVSNSADVSSRNLVFVHNDNTSATSTTCLQVTQDAAQQAVGITQNGNASALSAISACTTANGVALTCDSLTTGSALRIASDSSDASARNLVTLINDNVASSSTTVLAIKQDAAEYGIHIDHNADADAIYIDSEATTQSIFTIDTPITTSGNCINISNANSLTTGKMIRAVSNSADTSTRELVTIHNDNSAATNTKCLEVIQDADATGIQVTQNGDFFGIAISSVNRGISVATTSSTSALFFGDAANNSYAAVIQQLNCDRTASSSFSFITCVSDFDSSVDTEFDFRGDGNGFCDGSFTGGGADYAEFFEWVDGNPGNEDRRGIAVELIGDKIVPATTASTAFGVVSSNPSVVGDAAWNKWHGKYLRDEFGSYIFEDYEVWTWEETTESEDGVVDTKTYEFVADRVPDGTVVPEDKTVIVQQRRKLNPSWDGAVEYVPRVDRKEWACVGILGKLRIRNDQLINPNWVKMRDISDNVSEWLIK